MRRIIAAILLVCLLLPAAAMGAGFTDDEASVYEITSENIVVEEIYGFHGVYVYAEIVNKGKTDFELLNSETKILDGSGNVITILKGMRMYPEVVPAGEKGYLYTFGEIIGNEKPVSCSVKIKVNKPILFGVQNVENRDTQITQEVNMMDMTSTYFETKVRNNSNQIMYDLNVCFILQEKSTNKIVKIVERSLYRGTGIMPGSEILLREEYMPTRNGFDPDAYTLTALSYITEMASR